MVAPSRACHACRTPVPADAAFCSSCGAPTPTQVTDEFGGDFELRLKDALAERYTIVRELGRGGMAIVYLADDLRHERQVAIKILRPELAAAIGSDRFVREIKLAAKLNHPHILALYDSGHAGTQTEQETAEVDGSSAIGYRPSADGFLYYVMPYVDGESLRDRLRRERQLPIDEAVRITREVAEGLDYAHEQGVIHRDIKPENILLSRGHALIADFGIAKAAAREGATHLTSAGTSIGTPLYMSPEQGAGDPNLDGRTDLYSLGCVLYELLAGEPPFTAPTAAAILAKHAIDPRPSVRTVRDTVPEHLELAIHRAMAKVSADRFPTGAAFIAGLQSPGAAPSWMTPVEPSAVAPTTEGAAQAAPAERATLAPVTRFRWAVALTAAAAVVGISVDVWIGRGVMIGPFLFTAALLVGGLEYGRLYQAGQDWRAALLPGSRSPVRASVTLHREAWMSDEQEYGAYADRMRRARAHRAAIVALLAQLPKAEQQMLGDLLSVTDDLLLLCVGSVHALQGLQKQSADPRLASERVTRETRHTDLEVRLDRTLTVMEDLREELRRAGRYGLTRVGPSLGGALDEARAVLI